MREIQRHVVGDRIELTRVGEGGEEWNLYAGATGRVVEVRGTAILVKWDDPSLNGNDDDESPTALISHIDRWQTLEPAR